MNISSTRARSCLGLIAMLLALSACSTQPRRVNCEGPLQPINAPAPVGSRSAASSSEIPEAEEPRKKQP